MTDTTTYSNDAHPNESRLRRFTGEVADEWGNIPHEDRLRWARYLIHYQPYWPGFFAWTRIHQDVERGGTDLPRRWTRVARDLHAVGFTPELFFLLHQDLEIRRLTGRLVEARHGFFFDQWYDFAAKRSFVPTARLWAGWPRHVRADLSPQTATDLVLGETATIARCGCAPSPSPGLPGADPHPPIVHRAVCPLFRFGEAGAATRD